MRWGDRFAKRMDIEGGLLGHLRESKGAARGKDQQSPTPRPGGSQEAWGVANRPRQQEVTRVLEGAQVAGDRGQEAA